MHIEPVADRQGFWTQYQPGFRFSDAEPGTPQFFAEVERHRYQLESHIPEMAEFSRWQGRDVLEAGCGIGTDGLQFARAGARYTGMDFSPVALALAERRFDQEGVEGCFLEGSITDMPFPDASFDLVYSNGVIHHIPETERVASEMHRVLRPGGCAIVMVYHRKSINYAFSIMVLRRALVGMLRAPGAPKLVARVTGEPMDLLEHHRRLLAQHGRRYLTDRQLFLSHNTDGPGNPLSKVYTRDDVEHLFASFATVETNIRYLNARLYPGGQRFAATALGQQLARRWGWQLWVMAAKD